MIRFNIIVTVYNSEKWIEKNLTSLTFQKYNNWRGIVIDDNSTDNTSKIIKKNLPKNMTAVFNDIREGALHNQIVGVQQLNCENEDILVIIDGDDWLPNPGVFIKLAEVYQDPDVWLTYGSYEIYPRGKMSDKTRPATEHDNPRTGPMIYRHLRTFKYFLWKTLKNETLTDSKTNKHFFYGTDAVVMRPMVEIAGLNHIKHIDDKMYVYNFTNPLSSRKNELKLHNICCGQIAEQLHYNQKTKEELVKNE